MCVTCGCSDGAHVTYTQPGQSSGQAAVGEVGQGTEPQTHAQTHAHTHVLEDGTVITYTHHDHGSDHSHGHAHADQSHAHDHLHDHPNGHTHGHSNGHSHDHSHGHQHRHSSAGATVAIASSLRADAQPLAQTHAQAHGTTLSLEQNILSKNNLIAAQNRGWLRGRHITALNLVSSPGSGKTTLLVKTLEDLQAEIPISVIEGDQETAQDAERIAATGCPTLQVNTGTGCHLEAAMIERALDTLNPPDHSLVLIENVGNLVCPALFDLGEQAKVAMLSVTEGEDKPIKYPHMFRASQVMVLTKIDLLPYVPFDVDRCIAYARQVNPDLKIFQVSAVSGEGLDDWYGWLKASVQR